MQEKRIPHLPHCSQYTDEAYRDVFPAPPLRVRQLFRLNLIGKTVAYYVQHHYNREGYSGIIVCTYFLLDASMMNIHDHIRKCPSWQATAWRGFEESLVAMCGFFAALRMTGNERACS